MKTIEEKAKAYDEALERARAFELPEYKNIMESVFPELKESEDEKIKRELRNDLILYVPTPERYIAWLEKQGKHISDRRKDLISIPFGAFDSELIEETIIIPAGCIATIEGDKVLIKKQGKSALEAAKEKKADNQNCVKSADKVEPKFHEGEWVVQGDSILKIKCVGNTHYCYETVGGYVDDMLVSEIDSQFHLWGIQDAKDGDILATLAGVFIYNGNNGGGGCPGSYCGINTLGRFQTGTESHWTGKKAYPATKEQREHLFQKMADAGYEWNSEKKELKTIEQKTADKLEPKFKVRDWVVKKDGEPFAKGNNYAQITNIDKEQYWFDSGTWLIAEDIKLWTIADAKDGDVLAAHECFVLFKKLDGLNIKCYCTYHYMNNPSFHVDTLHNKDAFHPATKEQRDTLMKAVANAGYQWDAEKKELKTIEQKPVDKVEPKFKIEKDKWYVCVKDLFNGYMDKAFRKGDMYISTQDGSLIPSNSNVPCKIVCCPDTYFRDWTIQDAKDGDVLASELSGSIFLFRGIKDNKIDFYCDYDAYLEWPEDRFGINDTNQHYGSVEESQDIHPATKEQRDLFFNKMKDAGYKWDGEKKELRKIYSKTIDADKVVEWLHKYWPFNITLLADDVIEKFKKDFEL